MVRLGHAGANAALIYQHASADRDRSIADGLGAMFRDAQDGDPNEWSGAPVIAAMHQIGGPRLRSLWLYLENTAAQELALYLLSPTSAPVLQFRTHTADRRGAIAEAPVLGSRLYRGRLVWSWSKGPMAMSKVASSS